MNIKKMNKKTKEKIEKKKTKKKLNELKKMIGWKDTNLPVIQEGIEGIAPGSRGGISEYQVVDGYWLFYTRYWRRYRQISKITPVWKSVICQLIPDTKEMTTVTETKRFF